MTDYVIGVDLGGTKIDIGVIAPDNQIVARARIPTHNEQGGTAVVERIGRVIDEFRRDLPTNARLQALGICTPGPVDHSEGKLLTLVNLPGLSHAPLRQMLADRLGIPVRLEHDAKAAALGDFHYGAGRGARSMTYIVIGTGVGAAIIIDGQLYYGEGNAAGEVGHITIDRDGEMENSGVRGAVQRYASGPNLARRYMEAMVTQVTPDGDPITGGYVAKRALEGDPVAVRLVAEAGEALGIAIASMAMILDIELNVVGGGVAALGDLLLEPARHAMRRYCFAALAARLRLEQTALGDTGALLGCAWLARNAQG
ncbi:MAG: ROK family protein [Chloroflexota bacterium]|nr:ROK family protein [Chloroflexota bacterium]